jgi:hypothetical protein
MQVAQVVVLVVVLVLVLVVAGMTTQTLAPPSPRAQRQTVRR